MEGISFQYPAWFLVFCVLLGAAAAMLLYFRDKTFSAQGNWLKALLGLLRFVTVTLIAVLLLSPLLKYFQTDTKKPVIILAQDNSESVATKMDEAARASFRQSMEQLAVDLSDDYEVKPYRFGSEVREGFDFSYSDKVTNLSELFSTVYDLYSNQNLGAIVLAADGIYNEGSNPVYSGTRLNVPVFTIALGDTTLQRDLIIKRVFHNKIAYLGDKFSVQIDISAQNSSGSNPTLSVYKVEGNNTRKLQDLSLSIDRNDFFTTREVVLNADQAGVQRFRLVLSGVSGEASAANNSKDIFIDVLDARQKILILANSPHPDITALRQTIVANKNYQVEAAYINDFTGNVAAYDMVVLHQLPSLTNDAAAVLNVIQTRRIPVFFIVGTQTNINRLNRIQSLVTIRSGGPSTNEVQARVNNNFNLFTISEELRDGINTFPPLLAPFGEFDAGAEGQVLFVQRIGRIDTRYPLLVLGASGGGPRSGILCGEGLWKWRLFDFLQHQDHALFNEIIGKTVQFIGLKEDKRRFRVNPSKNIFDENEPVLFDAELYNDNYELVNEPDAGMVITDPEGKEYTFTFNKTGKAYTLNAGVFPVGNYAYRASTSSGGEQLSFTGQFSVQPIQLELYETTADHNLLRLLCQKYGGTLLYPSQVSDIPQLIREKTEIKPVIYQTVRTRSVINLKWIFGLLLLLLTAEWFLRRYFGGY